MTAIETRSQPPIFKADPARLPLAAPPNGRRLSFRTAARALQGMQKEALVSCANTGSTWRMLCDEGPWLNGTDLAPFPLGFFTAGLLASYMSEFLTHAKARGAGVDRLEVMVDNLYTMEGSLMRGTMTGSALPVEATFKAAAGLPAAELQELACQAVSSSPADACLRNAVDSIFTLNRNGGRIPVTRVSASSSLQAADPAESFAAAAPEGKSRDSSGAGSGDKRAALLQKLQGADSLGGDKLGTERSAAVGLADAQKRRVHVRGVGTLRADGIKALRVACFQPVGSVFQLLSDDSALCGGGERAPSGLAYLSAGIAFCFMTQLGRYAQVAKQKLDSYRIVQDSSFSYPAALREMPRPASSAAVDTHVFIGTQEPHAATQQLVDMGEQTCYLHAACRSALKTRVRSAAL